MRKITGLQPSENFLLNVKFDNDIQKVFDLKPYLHLPAFAVLKDPALFLNVVNKDYFIEWPKLEIDLSADTLWHEGK